MERLVPYPLLGLSAMLALRLRELGRVLPVNEVTSASIDPVTLDRLREQLSIVIASPREANPSNGRSKR